MSTAVEPRVILSFRDHPGKEQSISLKEDAKVEEYQQKGFIVEDTSVVSKYELVTSESINQLKRVNYYTFVLVKKQ
jgi:hypothetical protein